MELKEYMREIDLMKKQNYTEYDMYSIIASIIRSGKNIKSLSLRDVNRRQKRSKRGKIFYGLASMPDFVILNVNFENTDDSIKYVDLIYGCVEIKGINKKLMSVNEILQKVIKKEDITSEEGQLLGEVLWYKKVLYTNGLVWKYIKWNKDDAIWENIKRLIQERNSEENGVNTQDDTLSKWYREDSLNLKNVKIEEEIYLEINSDTNNDDWNEFVERLHKIEWNQ